MRLWDHQQEDGGWSLIKERVKPSLKKDFEIALSQAKLASTMSLRERYSTPLLPRFTHSRVHTRAILLTLYTLSLGAPAFSPISLFLLGLPRILEWTCFGQLSPDMDVANQQEPTQEQQCDASETATRSDTAQRSKKAKLKGLSTQCSCVCEHANCYSCP